MSLKSDAKAWTVVEQIVDDPVTGLTIQFEVVEGTSARFRLRIFGNKLMFGNRELLFDERGEFAGGGTFTTGECRPSWLQEV